MKAPPRGQCPAVVFAAVLSVLGPGQQADAFGKGDKCRLKAPLPVLLRVGGGSVEAILDRGTEVEILTEGDDGRTVLRADEVNGGVSTLDFESACKGTLVLCTARVPLTMYEETRSDSRSWQIKSGAQMNILQQGKTWVAVRLSDVAGFVKTTEMAGACIVATARTPDPPADDGDSSSVEDVTEEVERGDGPGIIMPPFHIEGAAPLGDADLLAEELFARLSFYRPDAARVGSAGRPRDLPFKVQLQEAARRAKNAEVDFALVGRLVLPLWPDNSPPPTRPQGRADGYMLQLALVEARTGKVLKGVQARPTFAPGDSWAERALYSLVPMLPEAPDGKTPRPPGRGERAE